MNIFGTDNKATTDKISLEHLYVGEFKSTFESYGSRGNSAIIEPTFVNSPLSSKASKSLNNYKALIKVSGAGGSIKSKCTKSLIPNFNKVNTTPAKFDLKISGYVSSISSSL